MRAQRIGRMPGRLFAVRSTHATVRAVSACGVYHYASETLRDNVTLLRERVSLRGVYWRFRAL
jgi:hypothetical protein